MNIQISPNFKKQSRKAISAIIAFIIFYIILLCLAFAFTIACIAGGIAMIVAKPMFFTLALGIGLAGLGVMIIVFLFKFMFSKHKTDLSNYKEITRKEEPKLFAFIDEIVKTTETKFPKKVYISSEVNASVFYDSSFWSMFLPIKKNLHIGLGLVNSVTHDELKAILSHEFGHFSQKSMKVGSYVYNVNQVIFNLLFDNDSYNKLILNWANVSGYFSIFVSIGIKIIEGIQWLLGKMYNVVNKNYLALSREMEFHADEVAANVTGYLPLKTSLLRLDLANQGLTNVISFYDTKIEDAITSENLFKEQTFVMNFLAEKQNISVENNLPNVTGNDSNTFSKSKLIIKNQWASHPETEERIEALEKLNIVKKNPNNSPANTIFENIEKWQKYFTDKIFSSVNFPKDETKNTLEEFKNNYLELYDKETFNPVFLNYYDNHSPTNFEIENPIESIHSFEMLFNEETSEWAKELLVLENDKQIIEAIENKQIDCNTFDFEGVKYKIKEAYKVKSKINSYIEELKNKLNTNDQNIFNHFYAIAKKQNKDEYLKNVCTKYLSFDKIFDSNLELYTKIVDYLQFTSETNTFENIKSKFYGFKSLEELFQKELLSLAQIMLDREEISKEKFATVEEFSSKPKSYFSGEKYDDYNLEHLYEMLNLFQILSQRNYFLTKKDWVDYQASLLK